MFKRVIASAAVVALAISASSARAGFIGFLSSSGTDTFDYTLRFTPEQPGETLISGDLVTIYNVAPLANITSAIINSPDTANFVVTKQTPGITPLGLAGAAGIPGPAADKVNVTFTYNGPTLTAAKDFSAAITTNGGFSGTAVGIGAGDTFVGAPLSSEKDTLFPILIPQVSGGPGVPEPASLGLLSLGALALLARRCKA